jgi:hypothetical protein
LTARAGALILSPDSADLGSADLGPTRARDYPPRRSHLRNPLQEISMPWKIFDYDQSVTIAANQASLAQYGDGVCLALSMLWCRSKKQKLGVQGFLGAVGSAPALLAQWMGTVQDAPLRNLFDNGLFKYKDDDGDPINNVSSTKGQVNNMMAYAYRLEKMSQWARAQNLVLYDDAVGFPGTAAAAGRAAATNACNFYAGTPILGLISLTGAREGHAMAFRYTRAAYSEVEFFDPNEGAWGFRTAVEFSQWLPTFFHTNYNDLGEQWWVLKFM